MHKKKEFILSTFFLKIKLSMHNESISMQKVGKFALFEKHFSG